MKLFLSVVALATICTAARLDNTYLPPANAGTAGGSGGLSPPSYGGGQGGGHGFGGGNVGGGGGGAAAAPGGFGAPRGGAPGAPGGPVANAPQQPQQPQQPPIGIISYENVNNGDGTYHFSYETENGIKAEEKGEVKNKGSDNEIPSVSGSYSYTAPDGQVITVTYIADENGFQPMGDHLPTPPPIPPEIQAGLDAIAAAQANNPGMGGQGGQGGYGGGHGGQGGQGGHGGSPQAGGGYGGNTGPEFGAGGFGSAPAGPTFGGAPAGPAAGYPSGGPSGPRLNPGQQQPQGPSAAPGNSYLPPANNPQVPPPRPGGNGNFNPQSGYNY